MKRLFIAIFAMFVTIAHGDDSVTISHISGGMNPNATNSVLATVKGQAFENIRKNVESIVRLLGTQAGWSDYGPDASHLSAEIVIGGKTYTINSWYPLNRQDDTIAVSEKWGLVSVSGKAEKSKIESQNSERYRTLVSIFDLYKKMNPQQSAAPLPPAPQAGPSEGAR